MSRPTDPRPHRHAHAAPVLLLLAVGCLGVSGCTESDASEADARGADAGGDSMTIPGDAEGDDAPVDATDTDAAPTDGGTVDDGTVEGASVAEQLGLLDYSGSIDPIEESSEGNVTTYTFDSAQGPMCMRGAEFRTSVRDTGSDSLVIFLQGGGACWSEFCLAVTAAPPGVPAVDILNAELEANPTADWNVVYLPYCDGSFFAGDADIDDNLNGNGTRFHRGLANLTASLEVAALRFPDVDRILLAGSSGGAYGVLLGTPMVRHYFPDAELIVMADSGIGIGRHGDPEFIQVPVDEFNLARFIPETCTGCLNSGHISAIVAWYMERDPDVRMGLFSSWYDSVLAGTFLQIPAAQFALGLRTETDALHAAYPDRFRRFVVDGTQHTSLLADPTGIVGTDFGAVELPDGALQDLVGGGLVIGGLDDTTIGDLDMSTWLGGLIDGDLDVWVDVLQEPGPAPEPEPEP